jgi:hypothetical protein
MEILKRFAFKSTTSSLKEREILFDELFKLFDSNEKNGMLFHQYMKKINYFKEFYFYIFLLFKY